MQIYALGDFLLCTLHFALRIEPLRQTENGSHIFLFYSTFVSF